MENDLIRRSDAVDMFQRLSYDDWNQGAGTTWATAFSACEELINMLPAVDAVEVVRCSDCVHFEPFRPHDGFCKIDGMLRDNDFFCKYGQRREEEHNAAD